MRPSFHRALPWPFPAANSSARSPVWASPARSAWAPERKASTGVRPCLISGPRKAPDIGAFGTATVGTATVGTATAGADIADRGTTSTLTAGDMPSRPPDPSNAKAETTPTPSSATGIRRSDIRIGPGLCRAARMGHRTATRGADLLGIFPQISRSEVGLFRLPAFTALVELGLGELDVERAFVGVDLDDVTVAQQRDRSADRCFRPDMADAKAARRAGKSAVGDERDLAAHALAVQCRGRRQHLAHPGTALGALVADDQHVAFLVLTCLHGLKTRFLAVETARRPGELHVLHTGHFDDRALGSEISLEADDASGREQRFVGRAYDVLLLVPFHPLEVLGHGPAGDRDAISVHEPVIQQSFHQKRHSTSFE